MNAHPHIEVLDCCETSRREFLKKAGLSAAALAVAPTLFAKKKAAEPETLVAQLYKSLNDKQRKGICFPWEHPLRNLSLIHI